MALSLNVMLPATAHSDPVAREDIALALSVVLLGLLMMVTRRNAVSQMVGFMSLENGIDPGRHRGPRHAAAGGDLRRLLAADRLLVMGIFLFRIRERFEPSTCRRSTIPGRTRMTRYPWGVLGVPLAAAGGAGGDPRLPADRPG